MLRLREAQKYTRQTGMRLGRAREHLLEVIATVLKGLGIDYTPVRIRDEVIVITERCVDMGMDEEQRTESEIVQAQIEEEREFEEATTRDMGRRR